MKKLKWILRIIGILFFAFPFVFIAFGMPNPAFLLIGMVGAILFMASFTIIVKKDK